MKKVEIPVSHAFRLINAGGVVLVTSHYKDKENVMSASWITPLSFSPPLIGVAIHPVRFTHDLIKKSEQFALNIPSVSLLKAVEICGTYSGRDVDKFARAGITPVDALEIDVPLVEECIGHIECVLTDAFTTGDHTLFVGQVVAASVVEEAFDKVWKLENDELKPLHHLGEDFYAVLTRLP
ncbi:MAG: flavin reductase family protein [Anaerolineae bacterium]|nr:flavin reductase family protein [Anaerolineae bacterium]MDW8101434.1 flavin reductase family protein [Anaerolineae bacterium]